MLTVHEDTLLAPPPARPDAVPAPDPWRPSEYTALLIQALTAGPPLPPGASALELGTGSGVVLACLARLGAARLVGTDIEPAAIGRAAALLAGLGCRADLLQGDLWAPVAGRRFDLIVANPPQFPTLVPRFPGRRPSWSHGGPDGRRVMDRILRGLAAHLAPGGRAVLLHNAVLGLDATAAMLARDGLALRRIGGSLVPLPPEKRAAMHPRVLADAPEHALRRLGEHLFLAVEVLEIAAPPAPAGG
ncbi:methyltransferase domain-containing protein [Paracraurococcus ruber]|uniref:Methyltransferase domain-containing protein n=1 Tax=Paracraurococcus ruber TaxID=77675 RepID=A0ABS1CTY3_9PROT|nr:methyltransferase domain-containing protein [Paracraurococcus ruber]MBK1657727.1 hypothetical protein [Paracraurococcus ruber]TDG31536.1 methyltransferase domain-containing protein [Paracraurococcus ruber]